MDSRTRRSPARFLAPLALIAVLIAFFAIISGSGGGSGSSSSGTSPATSSTTTTSKSSTSKSGGKKSAGGKTKTAKSGGGSSTYTVQVGDTLGGIADKTGVPLAKIQELNPDVDPHTLVAGQKIKLK